MNPKPNSAMIGPGLAALVACSSSRDLKFLGSTPFPLARLEACKFDNHHYDDQKPEHRQNESGNIRKETPERIPPIIGIPRSVPLLRELEQREGQYPTGNNTTQKPEARNRTNPTSHYQPPIRLDTKRDIGLSITRSHSRRTPRKAKVEDEHLKRG